MEEPNGLYRAAMYFFGGGLSAPFGAVAICLIFVIVSWRGMNWPPRNLWAISAVRLSLLLIACGSPALPRWYWILMGVWCICWLARWLRDRFRNDVAASVSRNPSDSSEAPTESVVNGGERSFRKVFRRFSIMIPVIGLVIGLTIELYYETWSKTETSTSRLLIIADSVTAGINDGVVTWPRLLLQSMQIEVLDASQAGATLHSARQQNSLFEHVPGLVILEIGGNDMLDGVQVSQFEQHLDLLLSEVSQAGRTLVMFELPLPPLCARYGMAQRRLATRYGVRLIPKRCFADVLTTKGSTIDGIHLSAQGQIQMAHLIRSLFVWNVNSGHGTYRRLGE